MEEQLLPQDAMDTPQTDSISSTAITDNFAHTLLPEVSTDNPGHPIMLADPTEAVLAEMTDPNPPAVTEDEGPGENEPYKGMLWIKEKFEEYRLQTDERMGALRTELDRRGAIIENLNEELMQAREKITDLSTKLEKNMSLLMNIHKELDRSLSVESSLAATPEAASGGSGELEKE